jgi:hypothetical protein
MSNLASSVGGGGRPHREVPVRHGSQKSFKVGRVNVEAGGQAIVGNIQSTRQRLDQPNGATNTFRTQKEEPRG